MYNSNSSRLFRATWLAGEKVLHFDKIHKQESRKVLFLKTIFLVPAPKNLQ